MVGLDKEDLGWHQGHIDLHSLQHHLAHAIIVEKITGLETVQFWRIRREQVQHYLT